MLPAAISSSFLTRGIDRLRVGDVHVVEHPDLLPVVGDGDSGQGQGEHVEGVDETLSEPAPNPPAVVISKLTK